MSNERSAARFDARTAYTPLSDSSRPIAQHSGVVDARPILARRADSTWHRVDETRDRLFDALQAIARSEGHDMLVIKSGPYVQPAWVKVEAWVPRDDAITERASAMIGIEAREFHKFPITHMVTFDGRGKHTVVGPLREFGDAPFEFVADKYQDAIDSPALSLGDDDDASTLCAQGLDGDAAAERLAWRPDASLAVLVPPLPPDRDDADAPPRAAGNVVPPRDPRIAPDDVQGPYVFMSYKKDDLPLAAAAVASLERHGVLVWYDAGIPGGAEWSRSIEEHLARSAVVLLVLTQRAVRSKWVRREAILADAIDKPILPLFLERVDLRDGLQLLLANTRWLVADADGVAPGLVDEVRRYVPARAG